MSNFFNGLAAFIVLSGLILFFSFLSSYCGLLVYDVIRKLFSRPETPEDQWLNTCEEIKVNVEPFVKTENE